MDYYDDDDGNIFGNGTNINPFQPILTSETRIKSLGNMRVWQIVATGLAVFLVIMLILYIIMKCCQAFGRCNQNDEVGVITPDECEMFRNDIEAINNLSINSEMIIRIDEMNKERLKRELLTMSIKNLSYLNPALLVSCHNIMKQMPKDSFA